MAIKLPGTVDDGGDLKSDDFGTGHIIAVKINLGDTGANGGAVTTQNGLPIITHGDVVTTFSLAQPTIGQTAVRLAIQSATRAVTVKALNGNTGTIYVGKDNTVAVGNGFELGPGESLTLPVDNVSRIWCIASADNQKVSWIAV